MQQACIFFDQRPRQMRAVIGINAYFNPKAIAMLQDIPFYVPVTFMLTTLLTLFFFHRNCRDKRVMIILLGWLLLQGIIAGTGFYTVTDTRFPRFVLLVLPPLITILCIFLTGRGKAFMNGLDKRQLTWLPCCIVPIVLFSHLVNIRQLLRKGVL